MLEKTLVEISFNLIIWPCTFDSAFFLSQNLPCLLPGFTMYLKSHFRTSACHPEKNWYTISVMESLLLEKEENKMGSHQLHTQFKESSETRYVCLSREGSPLSSAHSLGAPLIPMAGRLVFHFCKLSYISNFGRLDQSHYLKDYLLKPLAFPYGSITHTSLYTMCECSLYWWEALTTKPSVNPRGKKYHLIQ